MSGPSSDEEPVDEIESPALKALLRRSLGPEPKAPAQEPTAADKELLAAVQRKLRKRSKGKFYSDGWSTTQSRVDYALVAAIMLLTIAVVYVMLGPVEISR